MQQPLISIIIPLYNKEKYIARTINSILQQNADEQEIIVVDDGSTDRSVQVVKSIKSHNITIIQKANGGPSSARNEGVKHSKGSWILFLDADDILLPDAVSHFKRLIVNNSDCDVFVANYYMKKGNVFKPHSLFIKDGLVKYNFRSWFWETLSPCQGATLFRKDVLLKYPYPVHLRRWEDAAMFFDVMRTEKIYLTKTLVFIYVLDNSNASKDLSDINKDFLGHLSMERKSFWERMSIMLLLKQAKQVYPDDYRVLYGNKFIPISDAIAFKLLNSIKYTLRIVSKVINTISKPSGKNDYFNK